LRDAIVELTGGTKYRDDFDELEVWGGPFVLTPLVQEYPFNSLLPTINDVVTDQPTIALNMATLDVLIWDDPPTNNRRRQLGVTHYQDADRSSFINTQGPPSDWYRFGDNIGFTPVPSRGYQVQARILRMHPINTGNLALTPIILLPDWYDILIWSAVERGFMELLEFDKASAIHALLHGDPEHPEKPGLIQSMKHRRKREAWRKTVALRPIVRGYGYGHY